MSGAFVGNRTRDLSLTKTALYRLSYKGRALMCQIPSTYERELYHVLMECMSGEIRAQSAHIPRQILPNTLREVGFPLNGKVGKALRSPRTAQTSHDPQEDSVEEIMPLTQDIKEHSTLLH